MRNTEKWYICWKACRQRCNNPKTHNYKYYGEKGIKSLITKEEVYQLWIRDKGYLMKRPSLDRFEDKGNYTFNNCQFIELKDNVIKSNRTRGREIKQLTLNGDLIKIWKKIIDASYFFNIKPCSLQDALNGRSKTCQGFIWKYK